MKKSLRLMLAMVVMLAGICSVSSAQYYVVTNDDNTSGNTATIYQAFGTPTNPSLKQVASLKTGGTGFGGGYFAINSIVVASDSNGNCAYIGNGGSSNISVFNGKAIIGPFAGSPGDNSAYTGLGLAVGGNFLYANFTKSQTLATFKISPGCELTFVSDIPVLGLKGGEMDGMKIHGNLLVVTYGDGSYGSFNISSGTPVSNNDTQLSAGFVSFGDEPGGVDISANGKWAILGDATNDVDIEVAPITASGLGPSTAYHNLENASNSDDVWLSPDNTLLYVTNTYSGQVSAYNFNASTGALTLGCESAVLNKYDDAWEWDGAVQTAGTSGNGAVLWIAEFGTPFLRGFTTPGLVGMVEVTKNGSSCTLTEAASSPITDGNSFGLLTLAAFPPRGF